MPTFINPNIFQQSFFDFQVILFFRMNFAKSQASKFLARVLLPRLPRRQRAFGRECQAFCGGRGYAPRRCWGKRGRRGMPLYRTKVTRGERGEEDEEGGGGGSEVVPGSCHSGWGVSWPTNWSTSQSTRVVPFAHTPLASSSQPTTCPRDLPRHALAATRPLSRRVICRNK